MRLGNVRTGHLRLIPLKRNKPLSAIGSPTDITFEDVPPEIEGRDYAILALALKALRMGEMSLGRFAEYLDISRREASAFLDDESISDEEVEISPT